MHHAIPLSDFLFCFLGCNGKKLLTQLLITEYIKDQAALHGVYAQLS